MVASSLRAAPGAVRGLRHVARLSTSAKAAVIPPSSVIEAPLPSDLGTLFVGISGEPSTEQPGNGGLRLWNYDSACEAREEAKALAEGMAKKHVAYNTGFAGAKLVCSPKKDAASLSPADKEELLHSVGWVLDRLGGQVYTGCDLNISTDDVANLHSKSPYVLAALHNDAICPNSITAHGVVGAVEASLGKQLSGKRVIVHGCGAVGSVVASELRDAGVHVMTVDAVAERAALPGCEPLDPESHWWRNACDAIVPCSASYLITEEVAAEMSARVLVGATNLPFSSDEAFKTTVKRGIAFVPESVSSAGAVIGDSIEHYDRHAFTHAEPRDVYAFTRDTVASAASQLLAEAESASVAPSSPEALAAVARAASLQPAIGLKYSSWLAERKASSPASLGNTSRSVSPVSAAAAVVAGTLGSGTRAVDGARGMSTVAAAGGRTHDVIIAGAGIMGLNIAYQIKRRSPELKVAVLERQASVGHGSSGYSTGFQRAYYSFDETMQLALDGMAAYKNWRDYTGLASAEETFTETGALWMLGKPKAENEAMQTRLADFGIGSSVLSAEEVRERWPVINTDPFPEFDADGNEVAQNLGDFSAVYEHGCGHVDPNACLTDLVEVLHREGVDLRYKARVGGFLVSPDGSRCEGVRMEDGSELRARCVVNAAGPWFNKLMATAGVEMTTTALPTRIQVAHKYVDGDYLDLPFTADGWGPSGIYFMPRRANKQLVFGSVAHRFESEIVDPDDYNESLDSDVRQDYLNCLFHRLPGLVQQGEVVGFSSMYTVNQDDVHPMIGETKVSGLWACNGFSGHGFKLAPAVGALVAQQITGLKTQAWETAIPHDFMGPYREPLTLKVKTHFA